MMNRPFRNPLILGVLLIVFRSLGCLALYDSNTDPGLYILTNENFNQTVFRDTAYAQYPVTGNVTWVIQFYKSWCGHCIKFSPVFKAFGRKTQHWSTYLRVGTADCSYELNRKLCTRYHVSATPAIRAFSPRSKASSKGEAMDADMNMMDMLYRTLDTLERNNHPKELKPLIAEPLQAVWNQLPGTVTALAVICEPAGSYIGKETILHLLPNLHVITVRRALNSNRFLLGDLETNARAPFIVFLERNLPGQRGVVTLDSLGGFDPVKSFSEAILRADTELTNRQNVFRRPQLGPVYGDFVPRMRQFPQSDNDPPKNTLTPPSKMNMQDVNSAVLYALSNEVGRRNEIQGREFEALRIFIQGVLKYVPVSLEISKALRLLHMHLLRRQTITGTEVLSLLQQSGLSYHESRIKWVNCRGSVPNRRGYPCGLWQVFHTLTVRAYEQSLRGGSDQNAFGPDGPLTAIVSYIEHLFTCGECSKNFMKSMKNLRRNTVFVSNADAVLLIWRAHNAANRFLAGDFSEDPLYPKVQFPTVSQCPSCRRNDGPQVTTIIWDEPRVLTFLQQFYGDINIES